MPNTPLRAGRRLLCRLGLHSRPAVLDGTWPFPLKYRCPGCGGRFIDYGPEH